MAAPRGKKPLPTQFKVITGTFRKDRTVSSEARPNIELPSPPPHLVNAAKVEWGRVAEELFNIGLLSGIDRAVLAAYCQSYAIWVQASECINKMAESDTLTSGLMIYTSNGNAIQNPLVGTANKAAADMVKYATEFGMTPSSRSRINASPQREDASDPAAKYFG